MSTPYHLIQYLLSNDMLSKSLPTLLPSFYESQFILNQPIREMSKQVHFVLRKRN